MRNYSAKSFVLFGDDTRNHKELIKSLNGKWNRGLTNPKTSEKFEGWIFSNKRLSSVLENLGKYIEDEKSLPACLPVVYEDEEDYEELPSAPELPREFVVVAKPVKSYAKSYALSYAKLYALSSTLYYVIMLYFVYMLSYVIDE